MNLPVRTWTLDEFHGGIDRRDGFFTDNQTRFRDLLNCYVDHGKKLRRRPPVGTARIGFDQALLDGRTQGLFAIDGKLYTIAPKGTAAFNSGELASLVTVLFFDLPDNTSSVDWTLLRVQVFDNYACAWIRHTLASATYPSLVMLHVWDGLANRPTFVQDPYLPGLFSPSLVDLVGQDYDATWDPTLTAGVSKLWTNDFSGNTYASRTADPRTWNQRTKDSILTDGEYWVYVLPDGAYSEVIVPVSYGELDQDGTWPFYVLEQAKTDGTWLVLTQTSGAPASPGDWRPIGIASRFGGYTETLVEVRPFTVAGYKPIVRLRLVAGATAFDLTHRPSVEAVAGTAAGVWKLSIGETKFTYRGGSEVTRAAHQTADLTAGLVYILALRANALDPEIFTISTWPTGFQRESMHILATVEVPAGTTSGDNEIKTAWRKVGAAAAGTVVLSNGSTTVTGTGTSFTTAFQVGDTIRVTNDNSSVRYGIIASITSNTVMALTAIWSGTATAKQIYKASGYAKVIDSKTHVYLSSVLAALVKVGSTLEIDGDTYDVSATVDGSPQEFIISKGGAFEDYTSAWDFLHRSTAPSSSPITVTNKPIITTYRYAFENEATSQWYTQRVIDAIDDAGAEDALFLASASQPHGSGRAHAVHAIRNRMAIVYEQAVQLWAVDQDTNRTAYLDTVPYGAGDVVHPAPLTWQGAMLIPTPSGYAAFSVNGANLDLIDQSFVGEPIAPLPVEQVYGSAFWAVHGQAIMAVQQDGQFCFLVLDYSRESQITAWSQWQVNGVDRIDQGTLTPVASRLYFRSGRAVYFFDYDAVTFRDYTDPLLAYESFGRLHYNDFGKPGVRKRIVGMDIAQDGWCDIGFELPPYGSDNAPSGSVHQDGPRLTSVTYGRQKRPLALLTSALAITFSSRCTEGWRLQRIALDLIYLRR